MRKILIAFLLFTFTAPAMALITGTVSDKDGPLAGAGVVLLKNQTVGNATDLEGKFEIQKINPGDQILISFVGCKEKTMVAMANNNITLDCDDEIEKVVVARKIHEGDKCGWGDKSAAQALNIDPDAGGKYHKHRGEWLCKPNACLWDTYKPKIDETGTQYECVLSKDRIGDRCPDDVLESYPHATSGKITEWDAEHDVVLFCEITQCEKGFEPDETGTACTANTCDCGSTWNRTTRQCDKWAENEPCKKLPEKALSAHRACNSSGEYCHVDTCADGYRRSDDYKSCDPDVGAPCTPTYTDHVALRDGQYVGKLVKRNGKMECQPECSPATYTYKWINRDKDFRCVIANDRVGTKCEQVDIDYLITQKLIDEHTSGCKITQWDYETNHPVSATITDCMDGYEASKDGTKCNSTNCPCNKKWDKNARDCVARTRTEECTKRTNPELPENAKTAIRKCRGDDEATAKPVCEISRCNPGFEPSDDQLSCKKCECGTTWNETTGKCDPWNDVTRQCTVDNATSAYKDCDKNTKQEYCHVEKCADKYKRTDDEKSCIPDVSTPCTPTDKSAMAGVLEQRRDGTIACLPTCLGENMEAKWITSKKDYECVEKTTRSTSRVGKKCTTEDITYLKAQDLIDKNANACVITEWDDDKDKPMLVMITGCDNGLVPDAAGLECEQPDKTGQSCPPEWFTEHGVAHATAGEIKRQDEKGNITDCSVSKCESGFEPKRDSISNNRLYITECISTECTECGTEWDSRTQKCVPWRDLNCTKNSNPALPRDAITATKSCFPENSDGAINKSGTPYCVIQECVAESYAVVGVAPNQFCENKLNEDCDYPKGENIDSTKGGKWALIDGTLVCKANACISPKYYTRMKANAAGDGFDCIFDEGKDPVRNKKRCDKKDMERLLAETENDVYKHATGGVALAWDYERDVPTECSVTNCETGFDPIDGECLYKDKTGQKCELSWFTEHGIDTAHIVAAEIAVYNQDTGTIEACNVTKCERGYEPKKASPYTTECVDTRCPYCGAEWDPTRQKCREWRDVRCQSTIPHAETATRTCEDGKGFKEEYLNNEAMLEELKNVREICQIETCVDGYYPDQRSNVCVSNKGQDCTGEMPNAAVAILKKVKGEFKCVITACAKGFDLKDNACVGRKTLTDEQYQEEHKKLTENAQKMKEKENSLANKAIGAAGIGVTGLGTMFAATALSEQAADADIEETMRAYLGTFYCNYGVGKNVAAGETKQPLPNANEELYTLYAEYINKANDLKIRKEALGMAPGIESQIKIDNTHLYDDVSTGRRDGQFMSVARALANPDGEDATRWNEMRSKTSTKLTAGAIAAGVGAVGSLAANIAVNAGNQNQSGKILAEYDALKADHTGENNATTGGSTGTGNNNTGGTNTGATNANTGAGAGTGGTATTRGKSTRNTAGAKDKLTSVVNSLTGNGTGDLKQLATETFGLVSPAALGKYGYEDVVEEEVEEEPIAVAVIDNNDDTDPLGFQEFETMSMAEAANAMFPPDDADTIENARQQYAYEEVNDPEVEEDMIFVTDDSGEYRVGSTSVTTTSNNMGAIDQLKTNPTEYIKRTLRVSVSKETADAISDFVEKSLSNDPDTKIVAFRDGDIRGVYRLDLNYPSHDMKYEPYRKYLDDRLNRQESKQIEQTMKQLENYCDNLNGSICKTRNNICSIDFQYTRQGSEEYRHGGCHITFKTN